ncbi:MAG TPA: glycosyltransferase family 2 protein [Cyclobacteriaceae bacterium]
MKISVLTPSLNSGEHLERAIQSVKNQDYDNWEHIIVDGGSSDNTIQILNGYPHLRWISEPDRGQSDAMNKAFRLSSGDIIVYLNADDEFAPNIFGHIVGIFAEHHPDMVVGQTRVFKNGAESISRPTIEYSDLKVLRGRFPVNPSSYFYVRRVQETIGDFPIDEHYTMDYWFLLRAFKRFKIFRTDVILGNFHFTGKNKTHRVDSFKAQRSIAINHALKFDLLSLPYVIYKLYTHSRSQNLILSILRATRNKIRSMHSTWVQM